MFVLAVILLDVATAPFGLGNRWLFRLAHQLAVRHWCDFWETRRRQAIPKLASIIRDARCSAVEKKHAVQTLGLVVGQQFHHAADRWVLQKDG